MSTEIAEPIPSDKQRRASGQQAAWQDLNEGLLSLVKDLDEPARSLVRLRWLNVVESYDRKWREHRVFYYLLRVPIIILAATVPVLASFSAPKLATALVGLAVAILTGLDSFFRFGLRWQQQRRAAAAIEFEGWHFLELSGPYGGFATHKDALQPFLGTLEALNERFSISYLDLFQDPTTPQQRPPNGPRYEQSIQRTTRQVQSRDTRSIE